MARVDEFDDFYVETRRLTLAITYAKCGDTQIARDATVDAYRHAWRDWSKIAPQDRRRLVRTEAWDATLISRGTHPLRRREHAEPGALQGALAQIDQDSRRLIVLMTIANLDLDEAAREVGVDDERALELASEGFSQLENAMGLSIDEVVARLRELGGITAGVALPDPPEIRRRATSGARRNTVLLVAAAVVLTLVGGAFVADGDAMARQATLPDREKIGAESRDIVLDSHGIDVDDLLTTAEVADLRPAATWKVEATDTDPSNQTPYATCPTTRFADADPLKVFVRAYGSDVGDRATQSIEVSRSEKASVAAYDRLVGFYAGCEHPRTRLVDAYTVQRPFGDFQILRLQSYREPSRFITVGLAQSGTLTSTLVHESPGTKRTDVTRFAEVLNTSVSRVCAESGGDCTRRFDVRRSVPPPAATFPDFLGVVDLPPVANIDKVWSASEPTAVGQDNPAGTACDEVSFTGKAVEQARVRLFAIPEAERLPEQFALTQVEARLTSPGEAKAMFDGVTRAIDDCPDADLPARIDDEEKISGNGFTARTWRVGLEVGKDEYVYYRMGFVRRGAAVTQLLFPPAGRYAISAGEFQAVTRRAGERLAYAGN